MSIEGQGHFFTIYFPGFVCFVLYKAKISGERLQDQWSSGFFKKYLLSSPPCFKRFLSKLLNLIGRRGDVKGKFLKNIQNSSSQKP